MNCAGRQAAISTRPRGICLRTRTLDCWRKVVRGQANEIVASLPWQAKAALRLWEACSTQWRISFSGAIGLDYVAVKTVAEAIDLHIDEKVLEALRTLEREQLEAWESDRQATEAARPEGTTVSDYKVQIDLTATDGVSGAAGAASAAIQKLTDQLAKIGSTMEQFGAHAKVSSTGAVSLTGSMKETSGSADGLSSSLTGLIGKLGALVSAWQIGNMMKETVSSGIAFNSMMEDSELAIAGMIQTFTKADGALLSFRNATKLARQEQTLLRQAALETAFDYGPLLEAYQILFPAAVRAGFRVAKGEVVEFTKTLAQRPAP